VVYSLQLQVPELLDYYHTQLHDSHMTDSSNTKVLTRGTNCKAQKCTVRGDTCGSPGVHLSVSLRHTKIGAKDQSGLERVRIVGETEP
jgi:hypothetical protein